MQAKSGGMCHAPAGYQKGEWGWLQERPELWHLQEKRARESRSEGQKGAIYSKILSERQGHAAGFWEAGKASWRK